MMEIWNIMLHKSNDPATLDPLMCQNYLVTTLFSYIRTFAVLMFWSK